MFILRVSVLSASSPLYPLYRLPAVLEVDGSGRWMPWDWNYRWL